MLLAGRQTARTKRPVRNCVGFIVRCRSKSPRRFTPTQVGADCFLGAFDVPSDGISGNAGGVMCVRTPLRLEPRANPRRVVQPPRVDVKLDAFGLVDLGE